MNKGKFYGLSIGPGDPELITLKAVKLIEKCDVIAAPRTRDGRMLAMDIVRGVLDLSQKTILPLDFLMTTNEEELKSSHNKIANEIIEHLDSGRDVGMLNLGDISVYSTFSYIHDIIIEKGYYTELIPGVTSFCAAASTLKISLTEMKKPLHIIPSAHGDLHLDLPGTKVLMKSGKMFADVRREIEEKGLCEKACMISDCGLPEQKIFTDITKSPENVSYFTIVIVKD